MGITVDTSQGRALAARAVTSGVRLGARGSAVLRRGAFAIEADAKATIIALDVFETGATLNSVSTSFAGDGRTGSMTAEIGPTTDYAVYPHDGTSVLPGRPYMAIAFDRQLPGFESAVAQLANEVI